MTGKRVDPSRNRTVYEFGWHPESSLPGNAPKPLQLPNMSPPQRLEPAATPTTATPSKPVAPSPRRRRTQPSGISLLLIGSVCLFSGVGAFAFFWLTSLPPLPDCDQISPLAAASERLYCARAAAQSGDLPQLLAGIELTQQWAPGDPLYGEAQGMMTDWSKAVLAIAYEKIGESSLQEAVDLANRIPPNSSIYEEAQAAIAAWQNQWQDGEAIYDVAQTALQSRNWDLASQQVVELGKLENVYWRQQQADNLARQILAEKLAWRYLDEARNEAKANTPDQIIKAIALVQQIDPKSYLAAEANADLDQWSQTLIEAGWQRWQQGDIDGAIALMQQVPATVTLSAEAEDLILFSHAQRLAIESQSNWQPSIGQMLNLIEGIAAARRIAPTSQFYDQAQTNLADWQLQLQDLGQLQLARLIASSGQYLALQRAVEQAQLVTADRPRRLQAQTLVAHWTSDIQRIEDRPILELAQTLAVPGTLPDLQAAIAQASQITLGRALRGEAQAAIARWNRQVQTIEDRPILDRAKDIAQSGRLTDAIREADKITADRALYREAQSAIQGWQREILIARDRSLLDEAASLAAGTNLTAAINLASQIPPDRPLYDEAQAAIARWDVERAEIWQMWDEEDAQAAPSDNSSSYDDYFGGGSDSPY